MARHSNGAYEYDEYGDGYGHGYGDDWNDEPRRRRARRRARVLAVFSTVIAIVGATLVGAAVYVTSVALEDMSTLPETTTVYYSDGKTVMARLGSVNRTTLTANEIPEQLKQSAVAADDADFWTGNVTTITRSVVRHAYDVGTGPEARARSTVLAWKLDDEYSKDEILTYYLNVVPFGRGTHGVEAASQAYFGKTARRGAERSAALSLAEAIVLIAMIRQPEPDPADPANLPGFDPSRSPRALENSKARWSEIRASMVELGYLTQAEADALVYPETVRKDDPNARLSDLDGPAGLIVNHVLSELAATTPFRSATWLSIKEGGYTIVTTIDARAQQLLEMAADETVPGSALNGQPENLQAAAVVIEPGTGRVLAYFGGHNGVGADYAGFYYDEAGDANGYGAHPPGGSFHVHALAAALKAGISIRSMWNTTSPQNFPVLEGTRAVRDVGRCPTGRTICSLSDATLASLDTAYFGLTVKITPAAVLDAARSAGIDFMWTDDRARQDLRAVADLGQLAPSRFGSPVGIGQYAVTVLDQANAMATYAAGGLRARAHFLKQVLDGEEVVVPESLPTGGEPRILLPAQVVDLTWTLARTTAGKLTGRDSASKTGAWQLASDPTKNAHAWMVGFTNRLAMAVWVGNDKEEHALQLKTGEVIGGAGLPATIYRTFMAKAHDAMRLTPKKFPPPAYVGDGDAGNASG